LQPRVFGHAHLAATETPLATWCLLATLAAARLRPTNGLAAPNPNRSAVLFGATLAAAMTIKLTSWLLAPVLFAWLLFYRPGGWLKAIVFGVVLPPLAIIAVTPTLWRAPAAGLVDYLRNALSDPWKIPAFHLGNVYLGDMPWHAAFILVIVTTPLSILLLSFLGATTVRRDPTTVLFTTAAGVFLLARALGKMPQHDGERQFLPVFYFLAALAGLGAGVVYDWSLKLFSNAVARTLFLVAVGAVLAVEPTVDSWRYHAHGLCYYNRGVGGLTGAAAMGFEISYWFETVPPGEWRRVMDRLPPGSRVFVLPNHPGVDYLKESGQWRGDIRGVGPRDADFLLLYGKKAAYYIDGGDGRLVPTDLLRDQASAPAAYEIRFDGVRLLALIPTRRR
ncbi:MAG: hypothetical protein ACRDD1_06105, partial [Planctomycetia bacterium]